MAESIHARDFEMALREDDYAKLVVVVRGRTRLEMPPGTAFDLSAGSIGAVAAHAPHRLVDREPSTVVVLALGDSLLNEIGARRTVWELIVRRVASSPDPATSSIITTRLRSILHLQYVHRRRLGPEHELAIRSHVDAIIAALCTVETKQAKQPSHDRVRLLLDRISDAPFEEWTRDQAASQAGLSVRRFADLQREITHTSFQRWLTAVRARYAAQLITEGGYTASAAAFAAGFSSLPTFYRVFKREIGHSPGALTTPSSFGPRPDAADQHAQ